MKIILALKKMYWCFPSSDWRRDPGLIKQMVHCREGYLSTDKEGRDRSSPLYLDCPSFRAEQNHKYKIPLVHLYNVGQVHWSRGSRQRYGSDSGPKYRYISSWNEVLILPVNQRVPLIEVLLQTCNTIWLHVNKTGCGRCHQHDLWSQRDAGVRGTKQLQVLFLPRCRWRKASVALLQTSMAISGSISPFSFIIFPIKLPVRKVKSGKLWWTVPLKEEWHTLVRKRTGCPSDEHVSSRHLMVIIFLWTSAESSFFMQLMLPAHWNFSELMKKMGCFTRGKISLSKGNIQASNAIPHLASRRTCHHACRNSLCFLSALADMDWLAQTLRTYVNCQVKDVWKPHTWSEPLCRGLRSPSLLQRNVPSQRSSAHPWTSVLQWQRTNIRTSCSPAEKVPVNAYDIKLNHRWTSQMRWVAVVCDHH